MGAGIEGCVEFGVKVGVGVEVGSGVGGMGVVVGSAPAQAASSNASMAEVKEPRASFDIHQLYGVHACACLKGSSKDNQPWNVGRRHYVWCPLLAWRARLVT